MASLRTRLLVSVLALSAAGLIALAAVIYTEQRSFLLGRVDAQLHEAGPALAFALDSADIGMPPGQPSGGAPPGAGGGPPGGQPPGAGHAPNLPPGTYAQRRDSSGKVLGHLLISYGQAAPAAPSLPARMPVGHPFTVGSVGSSGLQYRVLAHRAPLDGTLTIVALPLHEIQQTLDRLLRVEGLVIIGVLAALGFTALFVVRLGLRPLTRIEVAAGEIAAGQLSRRVSPANQRTEVGRLGLALNGMLERLEQAFAQRRASEQRLRQFLADASHELRTPLASIRGYAELFRIGATRGAGETELAMRRIEEESTRMGALVDDMLALARLDRAPTPAREAVDVARLARDAVTDARVSAPDREISLDAPEQAIVSGDPHELPRVLANLLGNALVHTPARSPIEVAVRQQDDGVLLSVRDHGPGLPDVPPERLFDRFWRAQEGRGRGKAGAGLGLAIVDGVVRSHGGQVSACDAAGGGALFTVRLPLSAPAQDGGERGDDQRTGKS
ncbi:MAG TPA: HAMP domain-containing sensor histidine kinase [Solirubrobacteraceae bacterium]|nr:HAMP domain-containing sensor histidine kinase [Solirubrobacteraceae bacterium]